MIEQIQVILRLYEPQKAQDKLQEYLDKGYLIKNQMVTSNDHESYIITLFEGMTQEVGATYPPCPHTKDFKEGNTDVCPMCALPQELFQD